MVTTMIFGMLVIFFVIYFLIIPLIAAMANGGNVWDYLTRTWTPYINPSGWTTPQIDMIKTLVKVLIVQKCPAASEEKIASLLTDVMSKVSTNIEFLSLVKALIVVSSYESENPGIKPTSEDVLILLKVSEYISAIICS